MQTEASSLKKAEKRDVIRDLMHACVAAALTDVLKWEDGKRSAEDYKPMDELTDIKGYFQCIDYIANTYGHKIEPDCASGVGYYIQMYEICAGHPVFALGTLYALMLAGANIYIEYEDTEGRNDRYECYRIDRIIDKLIENVPSMAAVNFQRKYNHQDEQEAFMGQHPDIRHKVFIGDCANCYWEYTQCQKMGLAIHHPGAHILVAEYMSEEFCREDRALRSFGRQCDLGLIDYEAYHGVGNQVDDIYAGFDFGDLFWGFEETVEAWHSYEVPKDKRTVVIFTDKEPDQFPIPEYIHDCCAVVYGRDLEWQYPLYDFTQLIINI